MPGKSNAQVTPPLATRWSELAGDVFRTGAASGGEEGDWPDEDYRAAARACGKDREALAKLWRLCEDLESVIALAPGPGSLRQVAGVPMDALKPIEGRCWREALLDESLGRLAWIGIRNFARALKAAEMDSGTRRAGVVIHSVAVARLKALGEGEGDRTPGKESPSSGRALLKKPYLLPSLARILEKGN